MTYMKQMQNIVQEFRDAGMPWPAAAKEIAEWAIRNGKWHLPPAAVVNKCAEDVAQAMREEYFTDRKGRRVRLLHPAAVRRQGVLFTQWDDIRTAPRKHMQLSFQQRRRAIVMDCKQMKTDLDSYNDAHSTDEPLQVSFDFTMDLAEYEAAQAA